MSRKKILKKEYLINFTPKTVGDRINFIIANNDLTGAKFAKLLNISSGNLNSLINDDSNPSMSLCCRIFELFRINLNWLLAGEGNIYIDKNIFKETAEKEKAINNLLTMARLILESETDYNESLAVNIKSTFKVMELEKRTSTLEDKYDQLTKKLNEHGNRTDAHGAEGQKGS